MRDRLTFSPRRRFVSPEAIELVRQELIRRHAKRARRKPQSFEEYYRMRYPEHIYARHLELLSQELTNLSPGEALIINMPPRHGKTTMLQALIEWTVFTATSPQEIMYASYSSKVAEEKVADIRSFLLSSIAMRFWGLRFEKLAEGHIRIRGGHHIYGLGAGGSFTGRGATLMIIDDPVKSRQEAESSRIRERSWRWFRADAYTRLAPDARLIVTQTRWHVEDLTGRILKELEEGNEFSALRWKRLILPALAEENDPLGREPGEALFPERWSREHLLKIRRFIGEYDWWSLYQQRPFIPEGNVFQGEPARYNQLPDGVDIVTADTASSTSDTANRSAILAARATFDGENVRLYVREVRAGRWASYELEEIIREFSQTYQVPVGIEATTGSLPVIQNLQRRGISVKKLKPKGNKFSRAQPVAGAWARGHVLLPDEAPWVADFLQEVRAFTGRGDEADDIVDALAYAFDQAMQRYSIPLVLV